MSRLDIYKKQAKQLVRWHREGNYSIGGRIRGLARYRTLTDRQALALEFPLREAQEIIALEAGYANWTALKVAVANEPTQTRPNSPTPRLTRAVPVILVANVEASAEFFKHTLGSRSISCTGNHRSMAPCPAAVPVYISNSCTSLCSPFARRTGTDSSPPSSKSRT
jgi:hypothetical protein